MSADVTAEEILCLMDQVSAIGIRSNTLPAVKHKMNEALAALHGAAMSAALAEAMAAHNAKWMASQQPSEGQEKKA